MAMCRCKPFPHARTDGLLIAAILMGHRPEISSTLDGSDGKVPGPIAYIIKSCWVQNPKERTTFLQVITALKAAVQTLNLPSL